MVKFKQVAGGAIITADTLEELRAFKHRLDKEFPEHKYRFSNYSVKDGKHIATYYINSVDAQNKS